MPTTYKVLGQSAPASLTDTTLYTCPSSTQTVVSTISVCNRGAAAATFRIAVRPNGATLSNEHYVAYDVTIDGNATIPWTVGITMDAADVITVRASTSTFSFIAFGSEIT